MPPKKKQLKNAFYYFISEMREALQREEGRNYSLSDVGVMADPKWKCLSQRERNRYEEMAKNAKATQGVPEGKRDTYGNLIQDNLKNDVDIKNQEKDKMHIIDRYVQNMPDIKKEPLFFLSIKHFARTEESVYIPAEIGLVHYSLEEGIINYFHRFIDPGPIPTGYAFHCKDSSENVLHIPYTKFERADNDYNGIIRGIEDLLSENGLQASLPRVFCRTDEITSSESILRWMQKEGRSKKFIELELLDVSMLMSSLLRSVDQMMSVQLAAEFLNTHIYTYQPNTCCDYHCAEDYPVNCALTTVKTFCYVLSNHLCDTLDVKIVPGRHLPKNKDSTYEVKHPDSSGRAESVYSVASTASKSTVWSEPSSAPRTNQRLAPRFAPKPLHAYSDDHGSIIVKTKSKYDTTKPPPRVEASASAFCEPDDSSMNNPTASFVHRASGSNDKQLSGGKGLVPLRQPKGPSFAESLFVVSPAPPPLDADDEDNFPSLAGNSRSTSALSGCTSDASLGLPSNASVSSYSTNAYSSMSFSTIPESATPVGRGIGRGRPPGYVRAEDRPGKPKVQGRVYAEKDY